MSYIGFGIVHDDQPFVVDEFTGDNLTTQFVLSYPKPINGRSLIVTVGGSVIDDGIGADEFFVNALLIIFSLLSCRPNNLTLLNLYVNKFNQFIVQTRKPAQGWLYVN